MPMDKPRDERAALKPMTEQSAEEKYAAMDQALTAVLRAGEVTVTESLVEHLKVYDRCLRGVLGLPTSAAN